MGIDSQSLPRAVAFQTDLAIGMACLARLKVPQRLPPVLCRPLMLWQHPPGMAGLTLRTVKLRMTRPCPTDLYVGKPLAVRANPQFLWSKTGMATGTELRLMTPRAGPGIVQRPDRMDLPEIRPMAPGLVVAPVYGEMKIGADPPTEMAVLTEGLFMTVNAVVGILLGGYPMLVIPEAEVIWWHPFALVALVAFLDGYVPVLLMGLDGRHDQT